MLETEIKNLTAAIQLLTDVVNANMAQAAPAPVEQPVVEQPATPVVEEPVVPVSSVNVDALQTRCLELTRIDKDNSPKIKAIIATYGGRLVKDIPADKLEEFAAKLEELA